MCEAFIIAVLSLLAVVIRTVRVYEALNGSTLGRVSKLNMRLSIGGSSL